MVNKISRNRKNLAIQANRLPYFYACIVLFTVSVAGLASGIVNRNITVMALALICCWGAAVMAALSKRDRNIVYIFFLGTFYIFLLGKLVIDLFNNELNGEGFSFRIVRHTYICIFISLTGLTIGSVYRCKQRGRKAAPVKRQNNIAALRSASKIFALAAGFMQLIVDFEKFVFWGSVRDDAALRVSFASSIPGLFHRLAAVYILMLCIYLATLPDKKSAAAVVIQYMVINAAKLLYGSRSHFICGILFLIVYFILRDRLTKKRPEKSPGPVWFGRKEKIFTVILIPTVIVLMVFVGYYRLGASFRFEGFRQTIEEFFGKQGVSINVISNSYKYQNRFPQPKFLYLFDGTYSLIRDNLASRLLFGTKTYAANTVGRALHGTSLGQTLYYIIDRQSYLNGVGCGSSYIAEAYLGYGYIGVFVVNAVLSVIISKINNYGFDNWLVSAVILIYLQSLFFIPRSGFDSFLEQFCSGTHMVALILLWVIYEVLLKSFTRYGMREKNGCAA